FLRDMEHLMPLLAAFLLEITQHCAFEIYRNYYLDQAQILNTIARTSRQEHRAINYTFRCIATSQYGYYFIEIIWKNGHKIQCFKYIIYIDLDTRKSSTSGNVFHLAFACLDRRRKKRTKRTKEEEAISIFEEIEWYFWYSFSHFIQILQKILVKIKYFIQLVIRTCLLRVVPLIILIDCLIFFLIANQMVNTTILFNQIHKNKVLRLLCHAFIIKIRFFLPYLHIILQVYNTKKYFVRQLHNSLEKRRGFFCVALLVRMHPISIALLVVVV
ncbi:hypothetical protein ACJX0J_006175, partial [Zea mays]